MDFSGLEKGPRMVKRARRSSTFCHSWSRARSAQCLETHAARERLRSSRCVNTRARSSLIPKTVAAGGRAMVEGNGVVREDRTNPAQFRHDRRCTIYRHDWRRPAGPRRFYSTSGDPESFLGYRPLTYLRQPRTTRNAALHP